MINWLKNIMTKGTGKIKYIAYDDSVPPEEIEPYEDVATMEYEGKYDEFIQKAKLRRFLRITKNHLVAEMIVIERHENGHRVE